jgi:sugar O-acyltransferase (sialic acid O-acetyltransferase NeuD family)
MKRLAVVSADKEIIELGIECGWEIEGFFDVRPEARVGSYPNLGSDASWKDVLLRVPDVKVALSLDAPKAKEKLAAHYGLAYLAALISSDAFVSRHARIAPGCLIQRGVKVMTDAHVGTACKINVNATIHHDCKVGSCCTLAPGSQLLGNVTLEARVFVGAAAVVLPGLRIGADATIGAGAVVTRDVAPGCVVVGIPARVSKATYGSNSR